MSVDEDSFIVIEETPSMLQFSILDESSANSASIIENNSLFETNSLQQQLDKIIDNTANNVKSMDTKYATSSSEKLFSISPTKQPNSNDTSAHTSPNLTLAHSFLLGNINCDTMKVKIMYIISFVKFIYCKRISTHNSKVIMITGFLVLFSLKFRVVFPVRAV